jgi:hypothetical protein
MTTQRSELWWRKQMVINPPREDGRLHRNRAGLWQESDPAVQVPECRSDLAFLAYTISASLTQ